MSFRFGSFRFGLLAAAGALIAAASPARAGFAVDFAGLTGSFSPLTVAGLTFDSPSGASTFQVQSTAGQFSFATGLGDTGFGDTLSIAFATALTAPITLTYGIQDAGGLTGSDTLSVVDTSGHSFVGTTTLNGTLLNEPEGTLTINDPGATSLSITPANGQPWFLGSIATAAPVSTPEPMTLSVLGLGLAGLAAARRRRA